MSSVSLTQAQQLGQPTCQTSQPVIVVYGNGIRRTPKQAADDTRYLQDKATQLFAGNGINPTNVAFCTVYDSTYIEAQANQLISFNTFLQLFQSAVQLGLQTPEQLSQWLSNSSLAPPQFSQIVQSVNAAIDAAISLKPSASGSLEPDIANHLQIYQTALQHNQRIVVVAHSQGNLYVNQVYDLLFPSPSSTGRDQFKVIAVATPADTVAGGGDHTTLLRDPIYKSVDDAALLFSQFGIPIPPALPENADNGPCIVAPSPDAGCYGFSGVPDPLSQQDWKFHSFTDSYLGGNGNDPCPTADKSGALPNATLSCGRILNDIIAALTTRVSVAATLDGLPWPALGTGAVSYSIVGPNINVATAAAVPATIPNLPNGTYTLTYNSGGPPNSTLIGIAPCGLFGTTPMPCSALGNAGQTATFTLQFSTNPPTAGFSMSSAGQNATESQTLSLTVPSGGTALVSFDSLSRSSAYNGRTIAGWQWTIDGASISTASTFTASLGKGAHPVTLVVTDNLGSKSASAQGTVSITESSGGPVVVACPASTTLDVLVALGSCFSGGIVFSNVSYTPGPGAPIASGVSASLLVQAGGSTVYGWIFSSSRGWQQGVGALANFTLSFTIRVCNVPACSGNVAPGTVINLADATYAPVSTFPPGPETVNWSTGAAVTLTAGTPGPAPPTRDIGLGPSGTAGPITVTANFSGTGAITQTVLRFYVLAPTWTQKFPATFPPTGLWPSMVFDTMRNQVVLFVGGQTWIWDGSNWIQKFPITSPSNRAAQSMVYDSVRGEVVMFGGFGANVTALGDTWIWDGDNWTQKLPLTSPPARGYHAMASDSSSRVVLFGGTPDNLNFLGDTWTWDGSNWVQQFPSLSPSPRAHHAMTFDPLRSQTILYGGLPRAGINNLSEVLSDTWIWEGSNWTLKASTPSLVTFYNNSTMAFDNTIGMAIFYNFSGGTGSGSVWVWNGTTWNQAAPLVNNPDVLSGAATFDVAHSQVVLFGNALGVVGSGFIPVTWVYGN